MPCGEPSPCICLGCLSIHFALAALLKKQGHYVRAYELATFVKHHPLTEWWVHEDLRPLLAELEATLPPEVAAAVEARAKKWTLDDVVAEVLAEE